MSPNAEEGVWAEVNEIKKVKIQLGWLWGISPRSTTKWYKPGQSIGVYPVGLNPDGSKSGYKNNIESGGIGLLQVEVSPVTHFKVNVSNMFVENVFNPNYAMGI